MTTATTSPHARLLELEAERDQAHQKVRDLKRKVQAYDDETEALRAEFTIRCHNYPEELDKGGKPTAGTTAAKLQDKIAKRRSAPNPHTDKLNAAVREFHAADDVARQFRIANALTIINEFEPRIEDIEERKRAAFEALAEVGDDYGQLEDQVRDFIINTPGLDGQALTSDPRPADWQKLAAGALDHPLTPPGITAMGAYYLDQARQAEARKAEEVDGE